MTNPTAKRDVATAIRSELEHDERINLHTGSLEVALREGVVEIEGEVPDLKTKRMAVGTAHRLAPGTPLVDRVRVMPAKDADGDDALREELVARLCGESVFREYRLRLDEGGRWLLLQDPSPQATSFIDLEVSNGVVTLTGEVGSLTHRRLAEVLAWWVPGTALVRNSLRVTPPERDTDGELADAVRLILEKDPLVHADNVGVVARNGSITLRGRLASAEEKRLALSDAWHVPGVVDVCDEVAAP